MTKLTKFTCLAAIVLGTHAHAVQTCVLSIPRECEVIGTNYSASPHDTTHVVQVTCRLRNQEIVTYLTSRQAIMSTLLGVGRDFLPCKLTYATWDEDFVRIDCR